MKGSYFYFLLIFRVKKNKLIPVVNYERQTAASSSAKRLLEVIFLGQSISLSKSCPLVSQIWFNRKLGLESCFNHRYHT